ncbi:universal stress protein [Halostella sp. JP-L12]|uniref:universal stress protein n=1 Tax=Halostella TaxID=1843185 RepID=UPI000EF765E7|nr:MULTISPECIES: universal stress protein [Halostella]NHN46093.1 universal stress protein [Halostella sp. JP-L12]
MTINTLLVAVGEQDETDTDAVIDAVRTLGAPETRVVLAHAFDEGAYEDAVEELGGNPNRERGEGWTAPSAGEWHVTAFGGSPAVTRDESVDGSADEGPPISTDDERIAPDSVAAQYESIRAIGNALEADGRPYEIRGRVGDPVETVLDAASEVDADAIAVNPRDRSAVQQALFGSVSKEIIERADRPVVVV